MEVVATIALAFIVFLLVVLVVATKGRRPRRGVTLTLDHKSGEYVYVHPAGRRRKQ